MIEAVSMPAILGKRDSVGAVDAEPPMSAQATAARVGHAMGCALRDDDDGGIMAHSASQDFTAERKKSTNVRTRADR